MPDGNHMRLPIETRLAPLNSFDPKTRTGTVVVSSGAPVRRYDWMRERYYLEELVISGEAIDMSRLNGNGVSVLNNHESWAGLEAVLGRGTNGRIESKQLVADVRFSQRDDIAGIVRDIQDGIICDVSVGYSRDKIEMVPPAARADDSSEGLWTYRVIRWTPLEYSFVTIPADPTAAMRSINGELRDAAGKAVRMFDCEVREEPTPVPAGADITRKETTMPEGKDPAPATDTSAEAVRAAEDKARAEERKRNRDIREAVETARGLGLSEDVAKRLLDDEKLSVDQVRAQIIDELAKAQKEKSAPVRGVHIAMGEAEETKVRAAVASAIAHRLDSSAALPDNGAADFRYMSLLEIGKDLLERRGHKVRGLQKLEVAKRAFGTTDFPNVLANVMNKRLRQAYDENPGTYQQWAYKAPNAPDFKNITVTQISAAPDFLLKNPGDEIKYGSASDGKETYAMLTYARGLMFTREAMINDDLRAFDRLVTGFGASSRRLENRAVYIAMVSNPTLSDSVALFHATHKNYTSSGTAIDVTSLGVGRALFRKQTGLQGEVLNLVPKFLIVGAAKEALAYQYTSANYQPTQPSNINEFRQGGKTALTPIIEAQLDSLTSLDGATDYSSATKWYLAADPGQIDTVEYCYLDGYDGVWLEQEMDFDTDALKFKGRLDFATKAIDYRGLYLNAGA